MSENEKKSTKKVFVIIVSVIALLVIIVGCFFLFKKNTAPKTTPQFASQTGYNSIDRNSNAAALRHDYNVNYNGNYKYNSIMDITFDKDLSISEQRRIFSDICGAKDKNTFVAYMIKKRASIDNGVIITLCNGKYTKNKNGNILEYGLCYGDENKLFIYKRDNSGDITIYDEKYSLNSFVSLTGYWLPYTISSNYDVIYTQEKYYYDAQTDSYMILTCAYQMI